MDTRSGFLYGMEEWILLISILSPFLLIYQLNQERPSLSRSLNKIREDGWHTKSGKTDRIPKKSRSRLRSSVMETVQALTVLTQGLIHTRGTNLRGDIVAKVRS